MKTQVTQDLLFTYFAGHASAIQKQVIEEWAKESTNREVFYARLEAWESQHPQYIPDVALALVRHQGRMALSITEHAASVTAPQLRVVHYRFRSFPWMMAASVALLLLAGGLFRKTLFYKTYNTDYGEIRQVTLSDGSRVTLNANSCLTVARFDFGQPWSGTAAALGIPTREVALTGEATFSVTHTPDDRQFVVKTDQMFDVVVLGTEFTVYNRQQGGKVVLNRGKVQVRYTEGRSTRKLVMKPGDLVTLDQRGHAKLSQVQKPESMAAWRNNQFIFEGTPLTEIAQLFEDTYGLQLIIPNRGLAHWTVSGSFTAHNADELLETLMQASSLTYTRTGNRILIDSSH